MGNLTSIPSIFVKQFKHALMEHKDRLVREWISRSDVTWALNHYYIDETEFRSSFGMQMFESYADVLSCERKNSDGSECFTFMDGLADVIRQKKVFAEDILTIVWGLKQVINGFVGENMGSLTKEQIVEMFVISESACEKFIKNILDRKFKMDRGSGSRVSTIKHMNEYKNAIDEAAIVSRTDRNGIITYANRKFCDISGYRLEELIGRSHNIIRHPDMSTSIFKELWDTILMKKVWNGVVKNKKKNGGHYWVKTTIIPILDEDNEILEFISIRTDITELKDALRKNQDYEIALDEANIILRLDPKKTIVSVNSLFVQSYGFGPEHIIGKTIDYRKAMFEMVSWDPIEEMWHDVWKGIIRSKNSHGSDIFCQTTIIPIQDSNDHIHEYVVAMTDITEIEKAKDNLKKSVERLKELDEKKDDFINVASHELRTPLTTVKWYLSMVMDGDVGEIPEKAQELIGKVYRSADRLISLVNDMLDIAKLESGRFEFHMENADIGKILVDIADDAEILCKQKGLKFVRDIDIKDGESFVDVGKAKQVFVNLIGNAVKFTPEGGTVTVRARNFPRGSGMKFQIDVKDTGIWISESDRKKVFEKFGQVKNSLTRDISGTWLGLTIVKDILARMGGTISLESEGEWKGSTFTVKM